MHKLFIYHITLHFEHIAVVATYAYFNIIFFFFRRAFSIFSVYGTLPNAAKSTHFGYKHQPGKIADFTPGHSSTNDKVRREVSTFILHYFHCMKFIYYVQSIDLSLLIT